MAIDIDVQNDKFPYLARQICGDIAKAFGYGIDHIYEIDRDFITFLSSFSIDTLSGKWLDMLGVIMGLPRPYVSKPQLDEAFQFDIPAQMLDGLYHGFSTDTPITIDGVQYDRTNGGVLDNIYRETVVEPVGDSIYKKYLYATALLKRTHSIKNIADVLELFVNSTRYAITFKNDQGYINDIVIILSATSADYKEALQIAFDKIFTTAPFVIIDLSLYFDDIYTIPNMEKIIEDITGTDTGYTITYAIENKKAVFTITLDSSLAQYEEEILIAEEAYFEGASDVIVHIQVE